ncbi:phosphate starvation protein PhoH [Sorangium cellulosum So0157-2]|uniref:PhoH-like protein n=2 Tax=Sorangium cellulosum TaxID=56 RepID=S4XID3_SORCE|nr:phosphate starvation protein PhoH [Sorangium cellulosum So0157-2]
MTTSVRITADVEVLDNSTLVALAGPGNENLKLIARTLGIESGVRGNTIRLAGDADKVALAERCLAEAAQMLRSGVVLDPQDYVRGVQALRDDPGMTLRDLFEDVVLISARRRPISAKGLAQKRYIQAIRSHDMTFGIGPAGTGKTYLAMAMAVHALLERRVKRIILTRPAVEAGERLGFLPGDLAEKVNPYLRPLYDALHDMMDADKAQGLVTRGQIEVAPLAFMRGRTLNDCFVILDEAQNATSDQMRMFLTRLGYASRAVVTGDVTQVDLPHGARSGLAEARELLAGIEGIAICSFTEVDVVRHPLVQRIIVAYEQRDAEIARQREERRGEAGRGGGRGGAAGEAGGDQVALPEHLPGHRVERDHAAAERAARIPLVRGEELLARGDAHVHAPAVHDGRLRDDRRGVRVELRLPQEIAGAAVHGEHVRAGLGADEQHVAVERGARARDGVRRPREAGRCAAGPSGGRAGRSRRGELTRDAAGRDAAVSSSSVDHFFFSSTGDSRTSMASGPVTRILPAMTFSFSSPTRMPVIALGARGSSGKTEARTMPSSTFPTRVASPSAPFAVPFSSPLGSMVSVTVPGPVACLPSSFWRTASFTLGGSTTLPFLAS